MQLGNGAQGSVVAARELVTGRMVAIKQVTTERCRIVRMQQIPKDLPPPPPPLGGEFVFA